MRKGFIFVIFARQDFRSRSLLLLLLPLLFLTLFNSFVVVIVALNFPDP